MHNLIRHLFVLRFHIQFPHSKIRVPYGQPQHHCQHDAEVVCHVHEHHQEPQRNLNRVCQDGQQMMDEFALRTGVVLDDEVEIAQVLE